MAGGVTGGPTGLRFRGLVRQNTRGLCPVCGVRHAVCTSPEQPEMLYPAVDTRTAPLRPEFRVHNPELEREAAMPLVRSMELRGAPQMALGDYVADRRLYLNARGEVVEAKSPDAHTLLVAEGGVVPAKRARELGLVSEEQKAQAQPAAPRTTYTVSGPGPDDPGAFYDDGTPDTPAGNEGFSDVRNPRPSERERRLGADTVVRVPAGMEGAMADSGIARAGSLRAGGEVPASQDKTPATVESGAGVNDQTQGEPSGSGEDEVARREAERAAEDREREAARKSAEPAEDKAQSAPETKGGANPRPGGRASSSRRRRS